MVDARVFRLLAALTLVISARAAAQVRSASDPAVEKGRQVFERMKCLLCHRLEGKGGKLSGALDDIGLKRDAASLKKVLDNPQAEYPNSKLKMPTFPYKAGEQEALIAYLLTLRKVPPKPPGEVVNFSAPSRLAVVDSPGPPAGANAAIWRKLRKTRRKARPGRVVFRLPYGSAWPVRTPLQPASLKRRRS